MYKQNKKWGARICLKSGGRQAGSSALSSKMAAFDDFARQIAMLCNERLLLLFRSYIDCLILLKRSLQCICAQRKNGAQLAIIVIHVTMTSVHIDKSRRSGAHQFCDELRLVHRGTIIVEVFGFGWVWLDVAFDYRKARRNRWEFSLSWRSSSFPLFQLTFGG